MYFRVTLILQTNYSISISLSRSGGQLKLKNCIISDRRIPLLAGTSQCKSREFSRREYSISQLCSIRHNILVPLHNPGAYGQCSVFDHNGDKQLAVLGTTYWTLWPLYDQLEVGWLQPLQLWLKMEFLEASVLASRDRDLCRVQLHPTWFENQLLNVGVDQWLQICIMDTCLWVYVLTKGLSRGRISSHASSPIWPGVMQISSGLVWYMQGVQVPWVHTI